MLLKYKSYVRKGVTNNLYHIYKGKKSTPNYIETSADVPYPEYISLTKANLKVKVKK